MGLFQLGRRPAGCLGSDAAMPSPVDNPTCCASCKQPCLQPLWTPRLSPASSNNTAAAVVGQRLLVGPLQTVEGPPGKP